MASPCIRLKALKASAVLSECTKNRIRPSELLVNSEHRVVRLALVEGRNGSELAVELDTCYLVLPSYSVHMITADDIPVLNSRPTTMIYRGSRKTKCGFAPVVEFIMLQ